MVQRGIGFRVLASRQQRWMHTRCFWTRRLTGAKERDNKVESGRWRNQEYAEEWAKDVRLVPSPSSSSNASKSKSASTIKTISVTNGRSTTPTAPLISQTTKKRLFCTLRWYFIWCWRTWNPKFFVDHFPQRSRQGTQETTSHCFPYCKCHNCCQSFFYISTGSASSTRKAATPSTSRSPLSHP